MTEKNYYDILGVSKDASEQEIKSAYRKLAQKHHPDVNKTEESEAIFKEINRAYDALSDSLKRADYDQKISEGFVKRAAEGEAATGETAAEAAGPTVGMFAAAFGRTLFVVFVGVLSGGLLEFILWILDKEQIFDFTLFYPGMLWGALIGILLGADLNFKVESFLGPGYAGRTYTFIRTFLYALSAAYFGGRLFSFASFLFKGIEWLTFSGIAFGLVLGATFGSDGEGLYKLKDKEGRFNLLYTGLRAVEVGLIGLFMGTVFGFVLQSLVSVSVIFWSAYLGFSLGAIVGAIAPSNLAAYASYASAAVKNIIIILMVAGALLLGIVFSYVFHDQFQDFLKVIIK